MGCSGGLGTGRGRGSRDPRPVWFAKWASRRPKIFGGPKCFFWRGTRWRDDLEGTSRPISRILSKDDHLSATAVANGLPCTHGATYPDAQAGSPRTRPVRSCSGWGLPSHASHLACWWSLAPPFHPYQPRLAVCFLWHCPAGHPGWALPTILPCGVRTFLSHHPGGGDRDHLADSSNHEVYAEVVHRFSQRAR